MSTEYVAEFVRHVAVRAVVCLLAISLIKIVLPGLGVGPRPGLHVHVHVHDCISWAMCFLNMYSVHVHVHVHHWTACMTLFHKKKM